MEFQITHLLFLTSYSSNLLRHFHARWHIRQTHSLSTKSDSLLLSPQFFSLLSFVLRHVVFYLLVFLLPSVVQEMLSLVMPSWSFLSIWQIHLHFLIAISTPLSSCPVISLRSLLDITFGHLILNMDRKHRFTNTLSFFVRSFRSFQHSEPYSNTDFTLLLKILSFVLVVI